MKRTGADCSAALGSQLACRTKVIYSGTSEPELCKMVQDLCGYVRVRDEDEIGYTWQGNLRRRPRSVEVPVLPMAAVRQLPADRAVVIQGTAPPTIVRTERVWRHADYRAWRRAGQAARLAAPTGRGARAGPGPARPLAGAAVSQQVGGLAARMAGAEGSLERQAEAVTSAAGLAQEVSRLSAAIAGQAAPTGRHYVPVHPRQPVWAAMERQEYLDALRDLARWVSEILLRRHPHAAPIVAPRWPAHPAAVGELDWLYWEWANWAVNPDSRRRDAANWHDRWLPGRAQPPPAAARPPAAAARLVRHSRLAPRSSVPACGAGRAGDTGPRAGGRVHRADDAGSRQAGPGRRR